MQEEKLLLQELNNSMRVFEKQLTRPQFKNLKALTRWIISNWTTILSKLWNWNITVKKEAEKISRHLGNIDIIKTVEKKAERTIRKYSNNDSINAYDETDIFKPNANNMPWLKKVRDWSTWQYWNWYVMRWVNINGVSLHCSIDELSEKEIYEKLKDKDSWNIHRIKQTVKKAIWMIWNIWTWVIDRWWDIAGLFEYFVGEDIKFIIRAKKNKRLIDLTTWEIKKAENFKEWSYDVEIEKTWTRLRFHKIKNIKNKKSIMFYTNTSYCAKKCLEVYLKRWSIEEDFKKMKNKLWLEDIRVFQMQKIENIIAIIQFIIILSQDLYKRIMERSNMICSGIYLYFKEFCRMYSVTMNEHSFITYLSVKLPLFHSHNISSRQDYWMFGGRAYLKKMGCI